MYSIFSKFPFVRILIYWLLGILLTEIDQAITKVVIGILILLVLCLSFIKKKVLLPSFFFLFVFIGLSYWHTNNFNKNTQSLEKHQAFVFKVQTKPILKPKTWTFDAKVLSIKHHNTWVKVNRKIKVFLSRKCAAPQIDAEYLSISVMQAIKGPIFPNEQNWLTYYQKKGIIASVFIPAQEISLIQKGGNLFHFSIFFQNIQDALAKHITRTFQSVRNREVASAMLLGVRSQIDFDTMQSYASLGAIHILSVSGLHVGLLYLGISFLLGFLLKKGRWGKWSFFLLMMGILWLYTGISGFSAPVLRSAWMFSFMLFAKCFGQQKNTLNILAVSCFILLLSDPNNLFQSGFQLSYLAVLGLILYQSKIANCLSISSNNRLVYFLLKNCWDLTAVAIAAQIFTLPLVIYYFHQLPHPFYFFLLNPILILLSSISLGFGLFFITVADIIWQLNGTALYYFLGSLLEKSFDLLHGLLFYVVKGFNPVLSFLQIEFWEIMLLLLIFLTIELWIVFRGIRLLVFLTVMLLILLINHLFIIPLSSQQQEVIYLNQSKNQLVNIWIKKNRAVLFSTSAIINDPTWLQAHFSPLCAYYHVTDTSMIVLPPNVNISWKWKGKKMVYLQKASEKTDNQTVDFLLLGPNIKWKNSYWLSTWKGTSWYFVKMPSPYYRKKLATEIEKNISGAVALDTMMVISY